jgi:hypothetical protein
VSALLSSKEYGPAGKSMAQLTQQLADQVLLQLLLQLGICSLGTGCSQRGNAASACDSTSLEHRASLYYTTT